jgi:hypothetical protein
MIPMLRDVAVGLTVLGFLLILPTVASAHTQPRTSGVSQDRHVGCCDSTSSYARQGRHTWAHIQGIRLMVRMP